MKRRIEVGDAEAGERIDRLIARHTGLGRLRTKRLFTEGLVRLNGHRARKGRAVELGDQVELELPAPEAAQPDPDTELDVRLETPLVVVAHKPAGQPTAPLRTAERGTLAGALLARYPEMRDVGHRAREPGILHRLDTQTSGLLVAARSTDAFDRLRRALFEGDIEKRYLAVVRDGPATDRGLLDVWLAPDTARRGRVRVAVAGSRGASRRQTRYRVVRREAGWALLELRVSRAYRHQIRVSLAHAGHPIAGDRLYAGPPAEVLGERHALHASYVAWAGDDESEGFAVEDRLPRDLEALFGGSPD